MIQKIGLFDLCRPKQWPTISRTEMEPTGFPVYGANGIIGRSSSFTHDKPTVMVGCRGSVGTIHVSEGKAYINGNAMALDGLDETRCLVDYLAFFLKWRGLDDIASGSSQPQITRESLRRVVVPLPSLDAQRRIVARLKAADSVVQNREKQIADLYELEESEFEASFRDHLKHDLLPLQELIAPGTFISYGIVQAGPRLEVGIPYIRPVDIKKGTIATEQVLRTSPAIAAKFERSRVTAGDIVITIRATLGATAFVPPELDGANLTQGTARISPSDKVNSIYLKAYIDSQYGQDWIDSRAKGATIRGINLEELRQMPIPLPPASIQLEFARTIERIQQLRRMLERNLPLEAELFNSIQAESFGDYS